MRVRSQAVIATVSGLFGAALEAQAPRPEVFAPGVVSVEGQNLYRGQFTPDGQAFYFFRKLDDGRENYRIWYTERTGDQWQPAARLRVEPEDSDMYPAFSPDGNVMVISSYRPNHDSDTHQANLWYLRRSEGGWGAPVFMAEQSNTEAYNPGPYFGPDGALHYKEITWGQDGRRLSLKAAWDGTSFGAPEPSDHLAPWQEWQGFFLWDATLSPDASMAILGASPIDPETGRRGRTDLFVSFRTEAGWTEPVDLGPHVNSSGDEAFAIFTPDGSHMLFVRSFATYYIVPTAAIRGLAP